MHLLDNGNLLQLGTRQKIIDTVGLSWRQLNIRSINPNNGVLLWEDVVENDSLSIYINNTHEYTIIDSILYIVDIVQQVKDRVFVLSIPYFLKYDLQNQKLLEFKLHPFEKKVHIKSLIFHQNHFYAAGYLKLFDEYADLDCILLKMDIAGNLIWHKTYDFDDGEQIFEIESFNDKILITGVEIDGSNDFIGASSNNSFIAQLDTSGNILKKIEPVLLGGSGTIEVEVHNNQIYFLTTAREKLEVHYTQYLAQFDAGLNLQWDTLIPNTSRYNINSRRMEILNDQIIIASNINKGGDFTNKQIWSHAASWSLGGQFNWEHVYYYDKEFVHHIDDIEAMPNGDLIFMGTVFDRNLEDIYTDQHLWLFRTDSRGCGTVQDTCYYTLDAYFGLDTMVSVTETELPEFDLIEVLGNPFNEQLLLQTANNQAFKLVVFNIQGKLVYDGLISGTVQLNTKNWQSGVYMLQVFNKGKLLGVEKLVRQ